MYMLNNVVDRTLPCGTPVLNWRCVLSSSMLFKYECSLGYLFVLS